jgi:hypothetical protein
MTSTLTDQVPNIYEAQRRVRAERPRTEEWLHAQRAAVHARAAYWEAQRVEWDLNHGTPDDNRRPFRLR